MDGKTGQDVPLWEGLHEMPPAARRILDLLQQQEVSADALDASISADVELARSILLAVNSPFFARANAVTDIGEAVDAVGSNSIKALALGFSLVKIVKERRAHGFNHLTYWRRCIYCAAAARTLCARIMPAYAEDCFAAVLLLDLGTLVLDRVVEDTSRQAIHTAGKRNVPLPPLLNGREPETIAPILAAARLCAQVFVSERPAEAIAQARAILRRRYQFASHNADGLLAEIGDKAAQLAQLFGVAIDTVSYELLLDRAAGDLLQIELGTTADFGVPENRRQAARMRRAGLVFIALLNEAGQPGPRIAIRLRDLSSCGMGFISEQRMPPGAQFLVRFPLALEQDRLLLYRVARCIERSGRFEIGAELIDVLPGT
ncbi:MAG TPA: HDOD domain-containing protein [Humisphaera sp.]|nr:HDOD domain-containing protein [Humisphaera sp.]